MSPHLSWPLRRIVKRRERQGAAEYVVLACQHATARKPLGRTSRFLPCPVCAEVVRKVKVTGVRVGERV